MIFYFKITKNIQKNKFYTSFQFYFLYIFLVGGNLVSKYEQLLILIGIDASTLYGWARGFQIVGGTWSFLEDDIPIMTMF
jgi:hypothetical protein